MRETKRALRLILAIGLLAITIPAYGQEITGNISGAVTDPTGAAVPGAKAVVTNTLTGVDRTTTTTSAGVFFFTALPTGDYRLTVEKEGFRRSETTGIHLSVNDKLSFPVVLSLGAVTESVTVESTAVRLQTETGEVSNLISNTSMDRMPLNGRNFSQLVDMVPGVVPDSGRLTTGGTAVSVNGNLSVSNYFMIYGTFDMDNGSNNGLLVTPSVDSIEEFKILRNNYSSEFGSATGAIVNVVTKSGTREFHGSL
jgi:hypothetical protein